MEKLWFKEHRHHIDYSIDVVGQDGMQVGVPSLLVLLLLLLLLYYSCQSTIQEHNGFSNGPPHACNVHCSSFPTPIVSRLHLPYRCKAYFEFWRFSRYGSNGINKGLQIRRHTYNPIITIIIPRAPLSVHIHTPHPPSPSNKRTPGIPTDPADHPGYARKGRTSRRTSSIQSSLSPLPAESTPDRAGGFLYCWRRDARHPVKWAGSGSGSGS